MSGRGFLTGLRVRVLFGLLSFVVVGTFFFGTGCIGDKTVSACASDVHLRTLAIAYAASVALLYGITDVLGDRFADRAQGHIVKLWIWLVFWCAVVVWRFSSFLVEPTMPFDLLIVSVFAIGTIRELVKAFRGRRPPMNRLQGSR